jgi:hypothetical protein
VSGNPWAAAFNQLVDGRPHPSLRPWVFQQAVGLGETKTERNSFKRELLNIKVDTQVTFIH